ncbi:hypothetical protein BKA80DRAFT_40337 [Phyllosticta citrichinensis]
MHLPNAQLALLIRVVAFTSRVLGPFPRKICQRAVCINSNKICKGSLYRWRFLIGEPILPAIAMFPPWTTCTCRIVLVLQLSSRLHSQTSDESHRGSQYNPNFMATPVVHAERAFPK